MKVTQVPTIEHVGTLLPSGPLLMKDGFRVLGIDHRQITALICFGNW